MKSDEQIGKEAAIISRQQVLNACKKAGLTIHHTIKRVKEGLDAKENKVFYDKDRGKCVLSPDLIAWDVRSKSVDQSIVILGIKAPDKIEIKTDIAEMLAAARLRVKEMQK